MHGGAWRAGDKAANAAVAWGVPLLLASGYAVASVNHRYSQHAVFPAQIHDVKAAVRWLRANARMYGLDPDRFGAWGMSSGAHLVALLGTSAGVAEIDGALGPADRSTRVRAVVDWFGPTDFLQMDAHRLPDGLVHNAPDSPESQLVGGPIQSVPALVAKANPATYITPDDPPFLIVHGDRDASVPHHQSELLQRALTEAKVEATLRTLAGAGHGTPEFRSDEIGRLMVAFFDRHVKGISAQTPGRLDSLDAYIRTAMADWQIPGLAIAVVKDDKVVFLRGYGVRQVGTDARVDESTIFEFGSTTKAFTATAIAMLVSDGKLAWDDPVTKYVPWLEFADPFVTRHATIRDLLSHRVADGWGGASENFMMSSYTPREILRALSWRPPAGTTPPRGLPGFPTPLGSSPAGFRSRFAYENANYYAAAEVIGAVTGAPPDEFIRSRILRPLGMTSAGTDARDLWHERALTACIECGVGDHKVTLDDALVRNVAVLHHRGERGVETAPMFAVRGGAGGVHGSIADAARWLRFQTARGSIDGTRLMAERAFDEMHAPQVSVARPGAGNIWIWAYGLGWFLTDYHGRKASLHGGGFTAYIGLLRDERLGVMVLANLPSELREALVLRVFDAFVDTPPRDWSGELLASARKRAEQMRANRAAATAAAAPLPLVAYAGTYGHPAFGDLFVTHENGSLVLRFGAGQIGNLLSLGDHLFRVTWRGPGRYSSVVTFAARGERPDQLTLQFPAATFTRK